MKYDPETQHRRSIRLKGYDYAQAGAYFLTICTQNRECLFGEVVDGMMRLNTHRVIVLEAWQDLRNHYPNVTLDAFVVMPNHVHGIIVLVTDDAPVGAGFKPAPTGHGLPEIIRAFKTFSARRINAARKSPRLTVWQRNYYEHIIRNDESLNRIRDYIANNPAQWGMDRENPVVGAGFKPAPTTQPAPTENEPSRIRPNPTLNPPPSPPCATRSCPNSSVGRFG